MTALDRAAAAINAAEAVLMTDYSPMAPLAKGHLRIARLAVAEAQKGDNRGMGA